MTTSPTEAPRAATSRSAHENALALLAELTFYAAPDDILHSCYAKAYLMATELASLCKRRREPSELRDLA